LAQLLEEAKFHGIFIADVLGGYDVSIEQGMT
jgi:alkanesulfonate monooxygenase